MEQLKEATGAVSEFFQGNPFASPVGAKIEAATDGSLASEDWALNMEICDLVNMTDEGPRDALRAIRKRLSTQMGKNNTAVMYTLTVLETCVKNCDRRFHQLVASKEFGGELVRLIGPKFDPPQVVQEKVLGLIQSWADAFRSQPDLHGIAEVYADLKSKGVEFPPTDLDGLAPIQTPKRKFPPAAPTPTPPQPRVAISQQPRFVHPTAFQTLPPQQQHYPTGPAVAAAAAAPYSQSLRPEDLAKLRSELDVVNGNVGVMREMLAELVPGSEPADDLELLGELHQTCKAMQQRITTLLQGVANEEVTSELLLVNDELNSVFAKYDRYMANRGSKAPTAAAAALPTPPQAASAAASASSTAAAATSATASAASASASLIDFGAPPPTGGATGSVASGAEAGMGSLSLGGSDEPDLSLASAVADKQKAAATGATAEDKPTDLAEMEAWLAEKPTDPAAADATSKEFDQFLAARAEKN